MTDLLTWYRDALDEEERSAKAEEDPGGWDPPRISAAYPECTIVADDDAIAFIKAHSPAAVLADITAKRAVLDAYAVQVRRRDENTERLAAAQRRAASPLLPGPPPEDIPNLRSHSWELAGRVAALEHVVRLLAAARADRPGYREEWKP